MSHYDYRVSRLLAEQDPPFAALIMAAYRKADSDNSRRLMLAFPEITSEMNERYHEPGGYLAGEQPPQPTLNERYPGRAVLEQERAHFNPEKERRENPGRF